jgi:hypothetical protein
MLYRPTKFRSIVIKPFYIEELLEINKEQELLDIDKEN